MAESMRLIRKRDEPTRADIAEKEIRERQAKAPFGMGTIDAKPTGNYLPVEEILRRSVRRVDYSGNTSRGAQRLSSRIVNVVDP